MHFKSKLFNIPSIHPAFDDILVHMYQYLPNIFQNHTSEDNMYLAERIMYQVDDLLKEDMLNEYYYLPQKLYEDIYADSFEDLNVQMRAILMVKIIIRQRKM